MEGFYFARTESFLAGQVLQAQENREMPVGNSVQPEHPKQTTENTLSNTFCRDRKFGPAALAGGAVRRPCGVSAGIEEQRG
jgi:cytochrome c oxidase assembly protein Cox11